MKKNFVLRVLLAAALLGATVAAGLRQIYITRPRPTAEIVRTGRNARTLILDPGHGGADGGAVSVTGTYESAINLQIALRCRELCGLFGVNARMTRESEQLAYPEEAATIRAKKVWDTKTRTELVNSSEAPVLISIHQNKYTTATPHGCQVFYAPTEGSLELAQKLQAELTAATGESKRNAVRIGEGIYLMNHVTCPAILVECGFVSNAVEAHRLEDPEYQLKLASVIVGGYLSSLS